MRRMPWRQRCRIPLQLPRRQDPRMLPGRSTLKRSGASGSATRAAEGEHGERVAGARVGDEPVGQYGVERRDRASAPTPRRPHGARPTRAGIPVQGGRRAGRMPSTFVRDVLVRADDDDATRLAVHASQVEDVAGLRVGAEHLL